MAVKYVLVSKGNPQKLNMPKRVYAQAKSTGEVTLRKLSKEIAADSAKVKDTDILEVLKALSSALSKHLADGHIVRLGDFGSFKIGLASDGVEDPKKFKASNIKGAKIAFRPGADLKETLVNLKFEKGE